MCWHVSPARFVCDTTEQQRMRLPHTSSVGCGDTTAGGEKVDFSLTSYNRRIKSIIMLLLSFLMLAVIHQTKKRSQFL